MKAIKNLLELEKQNKLEIDENGNIFRVLKKGIKKEIKSNCKGYKVIVNNKVPIYQHRFLYAYYYGLENLDPELTINHLDYNKTNNKINNLEQITIAENVRHGVLNRDCMLENTSGCNLGELITKNGRVKKWVSQQMEVDYNTLNEFITGKKIIPKQKAEKISKLIGFELDEIYDVNPYH